MRRRTLSMRVSAIIMAAVVGMSSMTMHVQAAGTQERVVEDANTIRVTLPDSISLHGGGRGGGSCAGTAGRRLSLDAPGAARASADPRTGEETWRRSRDGGGASGGLAG